ncbi:hypothetical protein PYK79_23190 [Streptomyces sp. ID05-04B]|uniref:hypothetical protein n=1 Tax=Streptomyces sp. ID05-04B TaxID=3028661 RepID=UPI0029C39F4F|nr:hypothetical protein [Streptomyces sp. ID05-04B]MDX5565648.1 hypothetical protein [Streptomyces sp. ID05-04B]
MGRRKPNKPRRPRTGSSIPRADLITGGEFDARAAAAAYRCSDCHHGPAVFRQDGTTGLDVVDIPHSDSCPVRHGRVDALPDIRRAIAAASI